MPYNYNSEELYGRALFTFQHGTQKINVAFEYLEDHTYMAIIFPENDGYTIINPHDEELWDTLESIFRDFDNGSDYNYEIAAF